MKVEDVLEILSIPLLAIIPESGEVLLSSNVGAPVTVGSPGSAPAQAYRDAAQRLNGEGTVIVTSSDKPHLLRRLFTRRAA
ncbi:septum site-determining protein MinD, partial [Microvirga sp. BT688]|nr:septum site-determining protein MinD [Microvirga sp.]